MLPVGRDQRSIGLYSTVRQMTTLRPIAFAQFISL